MNWILLIGLIYFLTRGSTLALAIKPGVQLSTTPEIFQIRKAVQRVWSEYGYTPTITSSLDGHHMSGSKHYSGLAEDYRTMNLDNRHKSDMFAAVQDILGSDFQVLFEDVGMDNEHLHVEYDPS